MKTIPAIRPRTLRSAALFLLGCAWLAAFCRPAACVPEASPRRTVWDRIMEDQSAINLRRGYSMMEEEDYAAAADEFYKSARKNPESPWPRLLYGSAPYLLGGRHLAAPQFEKAVSLFPGYEYALLELAVLRERDGRLTEAIKLYRRALSLKPRDSVARFRLAWALRKAGRGAEVRKALE